MVACNPRQQKVQGLAEERREQEDLSEQDITPLLSGEPDKSNETPFIIDTTGTPTIMPINTPIISPTIPQETPNKLFAMCSPLDGDTIPELWDIISDPYKPPPLGKEERHHGVDFSYYSRKNKKSIEDTAVFAIMSGNVAAVINNRLPYGNMIIIETPVSSLPDEIARMLNLEQEDSIYHLYAHMAQSPMFQLGDVIACGQILGEVGKTGYNVVNAHLHLETRIGDPDNTFTNMVFYDTSASLEEMENYSRWRTSGDFIHFNPMDLFSSYLTWKAESSQKEAEQE
jgi:murein DD-endopeptidase MepM/ murein hydrolase activator NlpD